MDSIMLPFSVRIMPPKRPANSLFPADTNATQPVRTFRQSFPPETTFEEAWKKIQETWEKSYLQSETEVGYFHKIQDHLGNDFAVHEKLGAHFRVGMPIEECVLVIQQTAIDRDCSLPVGTLLQPSGYKRKRVDDLTPDRQAAFAQRTKQEARYGSAVSDLQSDTPIVSRETTRNAQQAEEQVEEEEPRMNGVFKIPRIPAASFSTARRNLANDRSMQAPTAVNNTQPQPQRAATALPSSRSALHQRQDDSGDRIAASAQPSQESPTERAAARNSHTNALQSPALPKPRQGTIPTPESNNGIATDEWEPTSAQRPRDSQAPRNPNRFAAHRSSSLVEPEPNPEVEDPIEDHDILPGDDDDLYEVSRGRTRSRSLESLGRLGADSKQQEPAAPQQTGVEGINGSLASVASTDFLPKTGAFDVMRSSQAAQSSKDQPKIATTKWTKAEDRKMITMMKKGFTGQQIVDAGFTRTASAIRNRAREIRAKHDGKWPDLDDAFPVTDGLPAAASSAAEGQSSPPPTNGRRVWSHAERATMRRALRDGLDPSEMKNMFPGRGVDAIAKQFAARKHSILSFERSQPDFPRYKPDVEGWTELHSLKVRRAFVAGMNPAGAYWRWFDKTGVDILEFTKVMKEYREQMELIENNSMAQQAGAEQQESADVATDGPEVDDSFALNETSQALPTVVITSSPPVPIQSTQPSSTTAVVSQQQHQTTPQDEGNVPAVRTTNQRGRPRRSGNEGQTGQTQMGQFFPQDKRKRADRPARPTTSELDAQFGRVSSRAPANVAQPRVVVQDGDSRSSNGETAPVEEESDDESESDMDRISRQLDEEEEKRLLDSQLLANLESDSIVERSLDSESELAFQTQRVVHAKDNIRTQDETNTSAVIADDAADAVQGDAELKANREFLAHDIVEPGLASPKVVQAIGAENELSAKVEESVQEQASVEQPETMHFDMPAAAQQNDAPAPSVPKTVERGQPGRLPRRTHTTRARQQQRIASNLRVLRGRSNDDPGSPTSATQPAEDLIEETTAPIPATTTVAPIADTTEDVSRPPPMPEFILGSANKRSVFAGAEPFDRRTVGRDGLIDAGRPGFPVRVDPNHPWLAELEVWNNALKLAKPEWRNDYYHYHMLHNRWLLHQSMSDQEAANEAQTVRVAARRARRGHMGYPPLESLCRPGAASQPDNNPLWQPDDDEDDHLDLDCMLIDPPLRKRGRVVSDQDSTYSDSVVHDRHFSEVEDDDEEVEEPGQEERVTSGKVVSLDPQSQTSRARPTTFGLLPSADIAGPSTRKQSAALLKKQEVHVYDADRNFIETRAPPVRSKSPIVRSSTPPSPAAKRLQARQARKAAEEAAEAPSAPASTPRTHGISPADREIILAAQNEPVDVGLKPAVPLARSRSTLVALQHMNATGAGLQQPSTRPRRNSVRSDRANGNGAVQSPAWNPVNQRTDDAEKIDEPTARKRPWVPKFMDDDDEEYVAPGSRRRSRDRPTRRNSTASTTALARIVTYDGACDEPPPLPSVSAFAMQSQALPRHASFASNETNDSTMTGTSTTSKEKRRKRRSAARSKRISLQSTVISSEANGPTVQVPMSLPRDDIRPTAIALAADSQTELVADSLPHNIQLVQRIDPMQSGVPPSEQEGFLPITPQLPANPTNTAAPSTQRTAFGRLADALRKPFHIPPAPKPLTVQARAQPVRLPFGSEDEDSSSSSSDDDVA